MHLADVLPPGEEVTAGLPLTADRVREVHHIRRDGTLIRVVVRTSPIRFGDAQARLEVIQDVTRERQVQARLQIADRVFENSGTAIAVTDADATVLSVNPAFTRTTLYPASEVIGRNIRVLNSGRHPPEFFAEMWRRLLEDGSWQGEVWNRRKDGNVYLESLNISAVRDEGGATVQYVASFVDVTAQRALEEKLARASRLAALGTLVTGVAHEVNNPLTGVMGAQGTALEIVEELDEQRAATGKVDMALLAAGLRDVRETLVDAQASAARIARIVRDLTVLGRPEAPRGRVNLAEVVDEALHWLPQAALRNATIRIEDGGAPEVEGSEGQLVQVLVNLVTNAAKAIPADREGHVVIRVGPGVPGRAVVEVEDDGCGMAPELVDRIFDPFFTTRKAGEGTGLGLPICNSIVAAHGGTISVVSTPGAGSTFRVDLPAAPA